MNPPPPASLVLLSALPSVPALTKVRFLGCISHYDLPTATLYLHHLRPPTSPPVTVQLDISAALDELTADPSSAVDLGVGAWLNVVGYVQPKAKGGHRSGSEGGARGRGAVTDQGGSGKARDGRGRGEVVVRAVAVTVWDAGALDVGAYVRALGGG